MFINCHSDISKNRLYISVTGSVEEQAARQAARLIKDEIRLLSPDFDVITDITRVQSAGIESADELAKIHQLLKDSGFNQIVRVVGQEMDQVIGKVQFDIVSKVSGIESKSFNTITEAETYLDNQC